VLLIRVPFGCGAGHEDRQPRGDAHSSVLLL